MQVNNEISEKWNETILILNKSGLATPFSLDVRDSCLSTMDLAKEYQKPNDYVKSEELENKVFISLTQTKGRGRSERVWKSELGGLYMTIAMRTPISYSKTSGLSLVVGTSVIKLLQSYGIKAGLKWPNDVLDFESLKKLAGILIESISSKDNSCMISIGVGLNINQEFSSNYLNKIENENSNPISMKNMSESEFNFEEVSLKLASQIVMDYEKFIKDGFSEFRDFWIQNTCMKNLEISYFYSADSEKKQTLGIGMFKDLSEIGSLILCSLEDDKIIELHSGEVSIRLDPNTSNTTKQDL